MTGKTLTVCRASAGSGKTFTLAAYYVALLLRGESFRSILAVTFTNKATAEMKERILTYLYTLGQSPSADSGFLAAVQQQLAAAGCPLDAEQISAKSRDLFRAILSDYDSMRVSTIDSFLQTLLTGMAQSLGQAAGFTVDLDTAHAISTAVDQIMSTHITDQEGLLPTISAYVSEQMNEERSWDIRRTLISLSQELFKEAVQKAEDRLLLDKTILLPFKEAMDYRNHDCFAQMQQAFDVVKDCTKENASIKSGNRYYSLIERVRASLDQKIKDEDAFRSLGDKDSDALIQPAFAARFADKWQADELWRALCKVNELCPVCRRIYLNWKYTTEHLNDLMLLSYVRNQINRNLSEDNAILLANTANVLANALMPGDADFILEKAGIRYRHIMLDEFQDTSSLQWEDFLHLIREILAGGGTTLIVGDVKQSIYRWRNGDWHIMAGLDEAHEQLGTFYKALPLSRNFRSRREVVGFNLDTFCRLREMRQPTEEAAALYDEGYTAEQLGHYYREGAHEGGFVQFCAYPYISRKKEGSLAEQTIDHARAHEDILRSMFDTMEQMMASGAKAGDMLILIRFNREAGEVIRMFRTLAADGSHPHLASTKLVSSDSFLLDSSPAVNAVIAGLRYVATADEGAGKYVELTFPDTDREGLRALNPRMPLYDLLEEIIRLVLCPDGEYHGEDIAYLNSLKDKVRDYVGRYGSSVRAFLSYWDDKMHGSPIPAALSDDIRILTVHSSKGLEAKHLFIPFCSWEMETHRDVIWSTVKAAPETGIQMNGLLPVSNKEIIREAGYESDYDEEHRSQRVDNINLLYVALTRAADNLFVYTDIRIGKEWPDHVGTLLLQAYGQEASPLEAWQNYADDSQSCFISFTRGDRPYIHTEEEKATLKPFSFSGATPIEAQFHSENTHICFRQSQESQQYSLYGAVAENTTQDENLDASGFGTICHDIYSRMEVREDAADVIDSFLERGIIDASLRPQVEEAIAAAWQNERMCDWFSGNWQLMREDAILWLDPSRGTVIEQRPDRVMIRDGRAIVLDYKFGHMHDEYYDQVRSYMHLMRELGYSPVEGYIWLAKKGELLKID